MRKMAPTDHEDIVCCRDTCDITCLIEASNYMYATSTNGALRQWTLPFDPKKVKKQRLYTQTYLLYNIDTILETIYI
jgi:hypothetical protein